MKTVLLYAALFTGLTANVTSFAQTPPPPTQYTHTIQSQQSPISATVFNLGAKTIFPVSSVLITGRNDAILVDAQFSKADAQQLVEEIKASGKTLQQIYISHGDPDYYFGLAVIHAAFPEASIVATPATVAHIKATYAQKQKIWNPQLGENAPASIIIPEVLESDHLLLEDNKIQIIGLKGVTPDRTVLWIPSLKTVVGGIPVSYGSHVWMADTKDSQARQNWLLTLNNIRALKPEVIIPGHFLGNLPTGMTALDFTETYIRTFNTAVAESKNAQELIEKMKKHYPNLPAGQGLEISAKVSKGEMSWQ